MLQLSGIDNAGFGHISKPITTVICQAPRRRLWNLFANSSAASHKCKRPGLACQIEAAANLSVTAPIIIPSPLYQRMITHIGSMANCLFVAFVGGERFHNVKCQRGVGKFTFISQCIVLMRLCYKALKGIKLMGYSLPPDSAGFNDTSYNAKSPYQLCSCQSLFQRSPDPDTDRRKHHLEISDPPIDEHCPSV